MLLGGALHGCVLSFMVPKVCLDDIWYNVESEGLRLICFHCGRLGHKTCPFVIEKKPNVAMPETNDVAAGGDEVPRETMVEQRTSDFGPAQPRYITKVNESDKGKKILDRENRGGSRFAALSDLNEGEESGEKVGAVQGGSSGLKSTSTATKPNLPVTEKRDASKPMAQRPKPDTTPKATTVVVNYGGILPLSDQF